MKTKKDNPSESFLRKVFTPSLTTWLLTLIFGLLLPLFSERLIANQLSILSLFPQAGSVEMAPTIMQAQAVLTLFSLLASYVIVMTIQIWILIKNQRIVNLLALPVMMLTPIFIWLVLPYYL